MKKPDFEHWTYKKHAKFVTGIYLVLYTIDMTLSFFLIRKLIPQKKDKE